ncbi:hypothetical protein HPB48_018004 [Haemaphysalis longicornis]|uniref:Uncharacterized protein n=1 Tax=Haemaphysalis longicornis TaxID=44386 RepID=A0A9J6FIT8_HAELO|nr:hypothetical protein HPB48_018004 [Haemaphysalis longicornis]
MHRRISNRHRGMNEDDLRRIRTTLPSRVIYIAPNVTLTKSDTEAIDRYIRKAVKKVLNIPMSTTTTKLLQLGISNSVSELVEGHLSSQRLRLTETPTGLALLQDLNISAPQTTDKKSLPQ